MFSKKKTLNKNKASKTNKQQQQQQNPLNINTAVAKVH